MFYTRCSYVGQTTKDQKRMHGRGIFTFSNGNRYVGTFHDGAFHGEGIIFFTEANGGGQFRGKWDSGRCISGEHIFSDGLQFETESWMHCTPQDRRYWDEYLTFIHPPIAGAAKNAITPDYSTTDGVPPAFAGGKPRGLSDVQDLFWTTAPLPPPEHQTKLSVSKDAACFEHDMATLIAIANNATERDRSNPKAHRPPVPPREGNAPTSAVAH